MIRSTPQSIFRPAIATICAVLLMASGSILSAQQPPPPPPAGAPPQGPPPEAAPPSQPLTLQQLDDLVAPIALYPDSLLSQILVACTYPLEVVEAQQWLTQNRGLQGQALMDAAKAQPWDPSVQALVAFPDVLARLNQDIRWTTDLGNAFLAQQPDVMNAVQDMRRRAQANGRLQSTAQQTVTTQTQDGQSAVVIQPTDPQVVYVPVYNPAYIWGPPLWGVYPPLIYPGIGFGLGFGPAISLGFFFGGWGGWGWGGWGWAPGWFGGSIIVNGSFFHRFGFVDYHGGLAGGAWVHDPMHRMGVPYANRAVAARFAGAGAYRGGAAYNRGPAAPVNRGAMERSAPAQRFGSQGFEQRNSGGNHSAFGGVNEGARAPAASDHGMGAMRAPSRSAPAPRAAAPAHGGGRRD